jgi:hypothetical protein
MMGIKPNGRLELQVSQTSKDEGRRGEVANRLEETNSVTKILPP